MTESDPTCRLAGLRRQPARLWRMLCHTARTLANGWQRARRWWQARSPRQRHLLIGVMLGVSIDLLLYVAHPHLTWLQEIEDMTIDGIMSLQAATTATLTRPATPFVVLDIDEDTYRAWGEPFHVPRDRLLKLIDYAVRHEAALVIVDVDLSQRGHDPAADRTLQDYLANYDAPGRPPLLLVRAFRVPPPERRALPAKRRSFLEDTAAIADSPLIHWGSTLFELDRGQRLRRWRLWQSTCDEHAHPPGTVVPSLQLLATAFLHQPSADPGQVAQQVAKALQTRAPAHCDRHPHHGGHGDTLPSA